MPLQKISLIVLLVSISFQGVSFRIQRRIRHSYFMHRVIRIIRLFRRYGGTFAPCLLSDGKRIGFTRRSYQLRACTGIHGHAFHAIRQCLSWNKRLLSDLVGIKRIAYSYFLRTPFSEIQYRCSSDNLVHRVARSCQRSFLDRNMSSRLTNREQSLWIRYRLLSHSLLFPIDFGDSHVFSKIQELEVKRKLSSLFDFNRCRNFPYLFRIGRPRSDNRLVYNIIVVDSQEALTTKTERFLFYHT